MTKIAVLVLNYKRHQDTISCVNKLRESDLPESAQIVILDNTPDNSSYSVLTKTFPDLTIIKNPSNFGFARGNNVGIRYALERGASHICLINPDVTVPSTFFKPVLSDFKRVPKLGIVAPALKHTVDSKTIYGLDGYLDWTTTKPHHHHISLLPEPKLIRAQFVSFACVLIDANLFTKGPLDERYFMYFEDVDFCISAHMNGYEIYLDTSLIATHKTSSSFDNPLQKLPISYKSHILFINKWLPLPRNIFAFIYQTLYYLALYLYLSTKPIYFRLTSK